MGDNDWISGIDSSDFSYDSSNIYVQKRWTFIEVNQSLEIRIIKILLKNNSN